MLLSVSFGVSVGVCVLVQAAAHSRNVRLDVSSPLHERVGVGV